ncbi:MAG: hypothetical protein L0H93_15520 [Nocardioides sp.]|nr:hypothetical protein [Nocardioides sp.]
MNPTKSKRFAFFVAGPLALSACGASSSDDTDPASSEPVEIVEVEGCEDAVFQPEFDEGKGPTRCQPGTPAPQPLEDKAEITFAIPTNKVATTYILSMAEALGEFDKENIDLTIETVPSVDALQLVADGKIDGFASGSTSPPARCREQILSPKATSSTDRSSRRSSAKSARKHHHIDYT